jgi:hypothetical protein
LLPPNGLDSTRFFTPQDSSGIHCETLECGKSSSISATEIKESNLFWVEFSSFIAIEKE